MVTRPMTASVPILLLWTLRCRRMKALNFSTRSQIPLLRERGSNVGPLAQHFLEDLNGVNRTLQRLNRVAVSRSVLPTYSASV